MPSARACTQAGTDNCTAILSVEVVLVQAQPAATSQNTISGMLRVSGKRGQGAAENDAGPGEHPFGRHGPAQARQQGRADHGARAQAAVEDSVRHGAGLQILPRDDGEQRPYRAGETGKQERAQQDRDAPAGSGGRKRTPLRMEPKIRSAGSALLNSGVRFQT